MSGIDAGDSTRMVLARVTVDSGRALSLRWPTNRTGRGNRDCCGDTWGHEVQWNATFPGVMC